MEKCEHDFRELLRKHNLKDLGVHSGTIYGVWADFRLSYLNPAWFRFARENGGEPKISEEWGLGRSILDCVAGEVKAFYERKWNACLDAHEAWSHDYECSSGSVYRRYQQISYPIGHRDGLLIVNSLVVERPHDLDRGPARAADESCYVDENGIILQCPGCRRVKNLLEPERWDWVSEWVNRCPKCTSHSFCPTCFRHYYPIAPTGE